MKNPMIRRLRIMLLALSFVRDYWRISKLEKQLPESERQEKIDKICRNAGIRMRDTTFALRGVIVKVGQFLSMREDILPQAFVNELKDLQDTMPAEPYSIVGPLLERALGGHLESVFAFFDKTAVAAASLAQVHKAILTTGETVAVKILRPNIRRYVRTDLGTLLLVAKIAHRFPAIRSKMNLVELHKEFTEIVSREVDCIQEREQLYQFREIFKDDNRIHVPHVYNALTRKEVIVMEYIEGAKISNIDEWKSWGVQPNQVVEVLLDSYLAQLLSYGYVHLDPHPGNLYILRDGRVCFLDFGMIGIFHNEELSSFRRLLQAVLMNNADAIVSALKTLGYIREGVDTSSFTTKVNQLLKGIKTSGSGKPQPQVSKTIQTLKSIIIDSPIQLQAKYMFLIRTTSILIPILRELMPFANWTELVMAHALPIMMAPIASSKQIKA